MKQPTLGPRQDWWPEHKEKPEITWGIRRIPPPSGPLRFYVDWNWGDCGQMRCWRIGPRAWLRAICFFIRHRYDMNWDHCAICHSVMR